MLDCHFSNAEGTRKNTATEDIRNEALLIHVIKAFHRERGTILASKIGCDIRIPYLVSMRVESHYYPLLKSTAHILLRPTNLP